MTTHTTAAPGADTEQPGQPGQSSLTPSNGHASPSGSGSSLAGGRVASTLTSVSSLGAQRPTVTAESRPPADVAVVSHAGELDAPATLDAPPKLSTGQDLAEPSALAEPSPLREPSGLVPGPLDDDRQVQTAEAAGSGSGKKPPSGDTKQGRGGRPRKDPEGRMALREHLVELRKRVVRAGIAILLGAVVGWFLYLPLIGYITQPLKDLAESTDRDVQINFNNVASSFDLQVKGAVWIGVIASSPLWIYQLWAFITPGLTRKERRYAIGFVSAAVPLFLMGVVLASLFIPRAVLFFTSFTPESGSNIIDAPTYIGFVMRTVLTFGLAFLLPVVLVALNFAGLLAGQSILKAWRWVLVAALGFAAVATPTPDITAMFILAAPIIVLFAIAILIAILHDRAKAKRQAKKEKNPEVPDDEASPL